MQSAELPFDEAARLSALHALDVLDTGPEADFDALVHSASLVCGAPISLISLIDFDRQWFKANIGLPGVSETPRDVAFCAHAILGTDIFEVPDAYNDLRFADNPLVAGGPKIRFYAGAPIRLRDGHCVGTVCVIDSKPGLLSSTQREVLSCLAITAARALETRHESRVARQVSITVAEQYDLMRVTLKSIGESVIATDASGHVVSLNTMAERTTGWMAEQAIGRPLGEVFKVVSEETRQPIYDLAANCIVQAEVVASANRALLVSRDGTEIGIEHSAAPILKDGGDMVGTVVVFHDVTEQRRVSEEVSHKATHDALTGLFNRDEFESLIKRVFQQTIHEEQRHALMYIDLDHFKLINDSCGHTAGDKLLQRVSKMLTEAVRDGDVVARLGGDEFAILLEDCPAETAGRLAKKICDKAEELRFVHNERRFRVGASIGLVPFDGRWATWESVLQAADTCCYAAKEGGRNSVHVWSDSDLTTRARQGELHWAARISQALDEDRFALFAQQIVGLQGPQAGLRAELLLRMIDTDGSIIPPGAFLPPAERFHLVSRIDHWVLRHAVAWIGALPAAPLDELSVNLSGQSVNDSVFREWAVGLLSQAGTAVCSKLCLEVTETAAVTHLADAALFFDEVRRIGVRVALDDFGAGASSFGYLKTLHVDVLKIDDQVVKNVSVDPIDQATVRCFIDLAKVVGSKTVAKFVDGPEVLERICSMGVDFAQGFHLHRPCPIDDLLGLQVS